MRRPPISTAAVCVLTVLTSMKGFLAIPGELHQAALVSPLRLLIACVVFGALTAFLAATVVGLWLMLKWAVLGRAIAHGIPAVLMTVNWEDSWHRYPILGPFVGWTVLLILLACTLPHWNRMTWTPPRKPADITVFE